MEIPAGIAADIAVAFMGSRINTEVLIVGGGPVGLTLAIDLAQRGIEVTVAETRAGGELPSVKCNHVAARTMEIFSRLGLVRAVREAGLPAEYPNDLVFRTTATGMELSRIPIPCRVERYTARSGPDTWWPTPEPPHRINKIFLEPVLFERAAATPRLRILNRTRVGDFVQGATGVLATAEDLDTGGVSEIFATYLIGCDGAHSDVRHVRNQLRRRLQPLEDCGSGCLLHGRFSLPAGIMAGLDRERRAVHFAAAEPARARTQG